MAVFVYGTLVDRNRADAVIGADDYAVLGPATLAGLVRVDGAYPTLAPAESIGDDAMADGSAPDGTAAVEGVLYAIADDALERLDAYEGVGRGLYVRVSVPLSDPARERWSGIDRVWTYVGDPVRLGLDERVTWPGDGPLEDRVRGVVERRNIVVKTRE